MADIQDILTKVFEKPAVADLIAKLSDEDQKKIRKTAATMANDGADSVEAFIYEMLALLSAGNIADATRAAYFKLDMEDRLADWDAALEAMDEHNAENAAAMQAQREKASLIIKTLMTVGVNVLMGLLVI